MGELLAKITRPAVAAAIATTLSAGAVRTVEATEPTSSPSTPIAFSGEMPSQQIAILSNGETVVQFPNTGGGGPDSIGPVFPQPAQPRDNGSGDYVAGFLGGLGAAYVLYEVFKATEDKNGKEES